MKAIRSIALYLMLLPAPLFAQPGPPPGSEIDRLKTISELIQKIKTSTDERTKSDAAYELVPVGVMLRLNEIKRTPDALIDDLASLLKTDNRIVAYHAALTLGAFRIRALRAVPALRQALADFWRTEEARAASLTFPQLRHGKDVGDAICRSLDAIGAPSDFRNCFNGSFIYPWQHGPSPELRRWAQFVRR